MKKINILLFIPLVLWVVCLITDIDLWLTIKETFVVSAIITISTWIWILKMSIESDSDLTWNFIDQHK